MTNVEMVQLTIEDRREDGSSVGLEPVLAALLDLSTEMTASATILGGGFPQGPNAGPLGHAIETDGPQHGVELAQVRRWLSEGELIDDIHLWNDAIAVGRFDSGTPYVIASKNTVDKLRPSFAATTVSAPMPALLAPNGWAE